MVYDIRRLSYGYELSWGAGNVALVILEDHEHGLWRCCRCKRSRCPHTRAVRDYVMETEGER